MARLSKARPAVTAESAGAGGGGGGESLRRSKRLLQVKNRSPGAVPPPTPSPPKRRKQIEEGSADDAGAEFVGADVFNLTAEEVIPYIRRLYKKRANIALLFYHQNNPDDHYEFSSLRLNDVYDFMDGMVSYMHMNFKAKNATTGSEKLFFAELSLKGDISDKHGGYITTACSIVDDSCAGGQKCALYTRDDLVPGGYDEQNCYVCSERIKHPIGMSYEGGHATREYWVDDSSVE